MLTKDEVYNWLKADEFNSVSWGNGRWYAFMSSTGRLYSDCGDGCCLMDYINFDEFWDLHGRKKDLKLE